MWQNIITAGKLQTGDIIQTSSGHEPLFRHYAIIYHKNGEAYVTHCVPIKGILSEPLKEFEKKRTIYKVFRNEITKKLNNEYIERKYNELKPYGYNFMEMNCEDYVKRVAGCYMGVDDRVTLIIIVSLVVITVLSVTIAIIKSNR